MLGETFVVVVSVSENTAAVEDLASGTRSIGVAIDRADTERVCAASRWLTHRARIAVATP